MRFACGPIFQVKQAPQGYFQQQQKETPTIWKGHCKYAATT
jgi:hypothetical protein